MSIAVCDSGVGGISVLKSLVEVMPNEDFIYYGDSANAPYGTKTLEQVRALTDVYKRQLLMCSKTTCRTRKSWIYRECLLRILSFISARAIRYLR